MGRGDTSTQGLCFIWFLERAPGIPTLESCMPHTHPCTSGARTAGVSGMPVSAPLGLRGAQRRLLGAAPGPGWGSESWPSGLPLAPGASQQALVFKSVCSGRARRIVWKRLVVAIREPRAAKTTVQCEAEINPGLSARLPSSSQMCLLKRCDAWSYNSHPGALKERPRTSHTLILHL